MELTLGIDTDSNKLKVMREKWILTTQYISIGHNPSLEIRLVYDLTLEEGGEMVTLTWRDKQTGEVCTQTQADLKGVFQ